MSIPAGLDRQRHLGPDWAEWLEGLPRRRDELLEEWALTPDGEVMHGFCSLVVPVHDRGGTPAALKVTFDGDDESEHEALTLQHWQGDGAVRLLRADPHRRAMLLERLHPGDLSGVGDLEACETVANLYPRLHRPALPQLRPLTSYVARWLDQLEELGDQLPVPPRMIDQALHLGRDLVADPDSTRVVVHGDLHYANVLAADREPWLAIDPKPMNGDPHYEVPPLLWNRWEEMAAADNAQGVRGSLRRRFHTVVDAAGLDEARARDWAIVRMVVDASWTLRDALRGNRSMTPEEQERITHCVAIVKAVQD